MGSKVGKVVLPLVALGVAAWATGGFGLAGAGAGGGAGAAGGAAAGAGAGAAGAGAAGATMGSHAASLAAAEAAAGIPGAASITPGLVPGTFTLAGGMSTTPGMLAGLTNPSVLNASGLSTLIDVPGAAATLSPGAKVALAGGGAAGGGFFSTLAESWQNATALEKAGVGLQAVGAAGGIAGAAANANAQKAAIALQAEAQRVSEAGDRLSLAEAELAVQKKLRRVLAAQTVFFNARGLTVPTGATESAVAEAGDDIDSIAAKRTVVDAGGQIYGQALSNRRRRATESVTGAVGGSLLDFGSRSFALLDERRRIG